MKTLVLCALLFCMILSTQTAFQQESNIPSTTQIIRENCSGWVRIDTKEDVWTLKENMNARSTNTAMKVTIKPEKLFPGDKIEKFCRFKTLAACILHLHNSTLPGNTNFQTILETITPGASRIRKDGTKELELVWTVTEDREWILKMPIRTQDARSNYWVAEGETIFISPMFPSAGFQQNPLYDALLEFELIGFDVNSLEAKIKAHDVFPQIAPP